MLHTCSVLPWFTVNATGASVFIGSLHSTSKKVLIAYNNWGNRIPNVSKINQQAKLKAERSVLAMISDNFGNIRESVFKVISVFSKLWTFTWINNEDGKQNVLFVIFSVKSSVWIVTK